MRRILSVFLLLLVSAALAQPNYGGVLRAGFQADPVGLDPHVTNATSSRNLLENTYDTLVRFDQSLLILPGLAESWEAADDGLSWTFHLRSGVTFHDGTPLTASDVAFSINRIKDPTIASPRADDFAVIQSIETTDDLTVVLHLNQPFSPLLAKLAATLNVIVSQAVVEANDDLQNIVIGTGPFRIAEPAADTHGAGTQRGLLGVWTPTATSCLTWMELLHCSTRIPRRAAPQSRRAMSTGSNMFPHRISTF